MLKHMTKEALFNFFIKILKNELKDSYKDAEMVEEKICELNFKRKFSETDHLDNNNSQTKKQKIDECWSEDL